MKSTINLFFLLLLGLTSLQAQQSFGLKDSSYIDHLCHFGIEMTSRYLLCYGKSNTFTYPYTDKMILLDKNGSYVKEFDFLPDQEYRILNVTRWQKIDEWLVDVEIKHTDSLYERCFKIINEDFETIREYCFEMNSFTDGFAYNVIDEKYIFIFNINYRIYGNIITGVFTEEEGIQLHGTQNVDFNFASSLINSLDGQSYIVYAYRGIVTLDKNIDKYKIYPLGFNVHGSLQSINNNRFAAFGIVTRGIISGPFEGIHRDNILQLFDENYATLASDTIAGLPETVEDMGYNFPPYVKSLDFNGEFLFTSTNYQMDVSALFQSNRPREIHVLKHDTLLNRQWRVILGGDVNTMVYGMFATKDGGCLVYGLRKTHGDNPQNYPYVVKLNSDGIITSTITDPGIQEPSLTLYGNPSNQLKFYIQDMPTWNGKLFIYDLSGKLMTSSNVRSGMVDMDTQMWNSGMYIIQIIDSENKLIHSVKWVKK